MNKMPVKQSVYADYLYGKMNEILQQGRGAFTLTELAKYAGLKVTGNMRRRITHCVVAGQLVCVPQSGQRTNGEFVYYRPDIWEQIKDIPF